MTIELPPLPKLPENMESKLSASAKQTILTFARTHDAEAGMHDDESTGVQIGNFSIRPHRREGYVWIQSANGEGGEFRIDLLEAAVARFYYEFF